MNIIFIAGKYASLYLKRVFFFDSNPPLGKLLLAAVAFVTGFDGEVKNEHSLPEKIERKIGSDRTVKSFTT